ncbi:MAG: SpoIID/LytB domain-containing protein [Candidatus Aerophobetes bacterium]|nr:SpoIID/LytB domain-containing protein [Candidatus Aerophobetes bacterium]
MLILSARKRQGIEFVVIFFSLSLFTLKACADSYVLRVKISSEKQKSVEISATGPYKIKEKRIKNFFSSQELKATPGGIVIGNKILGKKAWIKPEGDNSFIMVNGRRYRGDILIIQQNKSFLEVINRVPLEEYLYGVIRAEISSDWPAAVVRAQAIASRTYALKKLKSSSKNNKENYDLSSAITDQVYRGVEAENNKAQEVVDATKGKVIIYQGEVASIFYYDCCGGYAASSESVWGEALPYLKAKEENFCKGSPHYHWEFRIKRDNLEKILKDNGFEIDKIYSIIPLTFDEGGRVQKLRINYINGDYLDLKGTRFRNLIGLNKLRSTLFKVKKEDDHFIFTGRGRGHGVGMCQQGAKVMAERGFTTEEILKFYYPGTEIKKVY